MKLYYTYQNLPNSLYKRVLPSVITNPKVVIYNNTLANHLGLSNKDKEEGCKQLLTFISEKSNQPNDKVHSIAQAYAGHQFGHLNILGDGRAVLLGELKLDDGRLIDLQLKGSGRTPFSRGGDGKATLAPMLREYLISEAMHYLNIPTTRSLAVVDTNESIQRKTVESGAVLARTASSHIRVGTFVYASILFEKTGNVNTLRALLDYSVNRHYPEFNELNTCAKALNLLKSVIKRQASLVANWQRVGFIHGVMNTDNITISGETIDYGPCAFMDFYDEATVFSSIDYQGRYAFKNQMPIMWWNMARFAESLLPLISSDEDIAIKKATEVLNSFESTYQKIWSTILCDKVGLADTEYPFVQKLILLLADLKLDYNNTFMYLTLVAMKQLDIKQMLQKISNDAHITPDISTGIQELKDWLTQWQTKIVLTDSSVIDKMQKSNPVAIPRNQLLESALEQATTGQMDAYLQLLTVVQQPYNWCTDYLSSIQAFQTPASTDWNHSYQTFCGT